LHVKEALAYYHLVLNILRMTLFVKLSVTVLEAATWVK